MTDGRLRVILAGSPYPQPEGLLLFLEESGYDVLAEAGSSEQLLDAVRDRDPDLLVLGPEMVDLERVEALREVAPSVGIVAVTRERPGKQLLGAIDGHVRHGSSFGALTAELTRVAVDPALRGTTPRWSGRTRLALAAGRVGPIAAAAAILTGAWVLFATFPEGQLPPRADFVSPSPIRSSPSPTAPTPTSVASPLEEALGSLDRLVSALAAGDYERATIEAERLVRERELAIEAGSEVGPLDASLAARLAALTPDLPASVTAQLRAIFGDLMPPSGGVLVAGSGAFGDVPVGTTAGPRAIVVANLGTAGIAVVGVDIVGASAAQFSQASDCLGAPLEAGRSCTIDVSFRPSAVGARSAELRVRLDEGSTTAVALSGTGVLVTPPDSEPPIIVTPPDSERPMVLCDPVGSGWHGSDVVVACSARDVGSGLADPDDATFVLRSTTPAGTETASARTDARTICDRERNCITVGPIGGIKIDKRPPDVTCDRPDGGWHAADVTATCTARDHGSGLRSDPSFTLSTNVARDVETADAKTGTRSVCDRVGNCSTAGPVGGIKVDRKAPGIDCDAPPPGWHAENARITCSATDGGAGLTAADASFTLATEVAAGSETADAKTGTRSVCDRVGNCSTAGPVGGIKVDRKAPGITISAPGSGAVYLLDQGVNATFTCTDGGSGTSVCQGSGRVDTSTVGNRSFSVTARDDVGNETTHTVGYVVTYGVQLLADPDEETKKVEIRLVNVDGVNVSSAQIGVTALDIDGASLSRRLAYIPGQRAYRLNLPGNLEEGRHVLRFTAEDDPVVHSVTFTSD